MNLKVYDVHTHFTIETSEVAEDARALGFKVMNKSIEEHLEVMDRLGITYSLLTCPTLKHLDNEELCKAYCRQVNDAGAKLARTYPDRLGFGATVRCSGEGKVYDNFTPECTYGVPEGPNYRSGTSNV